MNKDSGWEKRKGLKGGMKREGERRIVERETDIFI